MTFEQWKVGRISVTKVTETDEWQPFETWLHILRASTRREILDMQWLTPTYLRDDKVNLFVHSFLVETPTRKIVIDTGIGNGKKRASPILDNLDTDFLERFEQVWPCKLVDGVLATHLHLDHVGWNTRLEGGQWVPAFPNARYYFVRAEYEHWRSYAHDPLAPQAFSEFAQAMIDGASVFEDSLKPVEDAGRIEWVEPGQEITPGITLLSTPGHTPGHVSVLIESAGESAVVTGDLFHTQAQIARPDWGAAMDADPAAAEQARRAFIERFADSPTLVLGTHFGTPTGGYIVRDGDSHRLVPRLSD